MKTFLCLFTILSTKCIFGAVDFDPDNPFEKLFEESQKTNEQLLHIQETVELILDEIKGEIFIQGEEKDEN